MADATVRGGLPPVRRIVPVAAGAVLLAVLYCFGYFGDPAVPGGNPEASMVWWDWWDQSQYIASARALAAGDWTPARHWYPLGYAILAAPLIPVLDAGAFFVVDLACLLACYAGFLAFARRVGIGTVCAAATFVLAVAADPKLFATWCEPWNTSPTAALLWLVLAMVAAHFAAPAVALLRLAAIGVAAAAIPLIRPADGASAALCVAAVLLHDAVARRLGWRELACLALGGALAAVPYAVLHLRIYGPHLTAYVEHSRQIGFAFDDLGFKAFVLLVEPRAWFGTGTGLLQRAPWIVAGLAGIAPALWVARGPARSALALLVVVTLAQSALDLSYVDLLPTGLWRYGNVHYFKAMLPALGLLAVLWVRSLMRGPRAVALAGLAAVLALLCVRVAPTPAGPQDRARLAWFPGLADDGASFDARLALQDARGRLPNIGAVRFVSRPQGLTAIALLRALRQPVTWAPGATPPGAAADSAPTLFSERISFGWPCLLPPYPCRWAPR